MNDFEIVVGSLSREIRLKKSVEVAARQLSP